MTDVNTVGLVVGLLVAAAAACIGWVVRRPRAPSPTLPPRPPTGEGLEVERAVEDADRRRDDLVAERDADPRAHAEALADRVNRRGQR